jgi:cation:H+ antiporter
LLNQAKRVKIGFMLILWILVFIVSLAVLVKGSDWLITSAEKIGLAAGLSPFIVGVTIVGLGTSFPELVAAIVAVFQGVKDVAVSNAVGSNIANILLIVGLSALVGKKLIVNKNLIDLDLPLLAIATTLLLGILWDKQVTTGEAVLMLSTYGVYLLYTVMHKEEISAEAQSEAETLPSRVERRGHILAHKNEVVSAVPIVTSKDYLLLVLGIVALSLGAKYLIDALVALSTMLNIATGVIAITAVAIGTSLPELFVSFKAAMQNKSEVALGNIFGSNVFNALVVIGIPALFTTLSVDPQTFSIGIPTMAMATLLFVISGISKKIYMWEGAFYLALYILFLAKLFNWF